MTKIKIIPKQTLPGAVPLTASELNNIRFSDKHTPLTPEILEQKVPRSSASPDASSPASSSSSSSGATITLS